MKGSSSKRPADADPGLFASSAIPDFIMYIDGGSRGNPGPAGFGVVIQDAAGNPVATLSRSIGKATNNVAEYSGLLAALEYAVEKRAHRLQIYCDSELVVRQMQGRYRVQSPDLKPLYQQARDLAARLEQFRIAHIRRERNAAADELANAAMDGATGSAPAVSRRAVAAPDASAEQRLIAVCQNGRLLPLSSSPALEEGAEYDVRLRRRD